MAAAYAPVHTDLPHFVKSAWTTCTGGDASFGATNPLWIARYGTAVDTLPAGWSERTVWQYTDSPLDKDRFNGAPDRLQAFALG